MPPSPSVSAAQAEAAETLASMMESHQLRSTKNRGEEEAGGPRRDESTTSPPQASHATTSSAAATTSLVGENEQHLPAPPLQADETRTHLRPLGPGYHDDDGPVVPRMHPPRTAGYLSARRDVGMSPEGGGGGGGDILSRMVTIAAPGAGLRVASMEDFRRSVHRGGSPDGMRGGGEAGADPTTALNNNTPAGGVSDTDRASSSSDNSGRDATAASPPGGPSLSSRGNPLLRMMEERMAARQRQQSQSQARTAQTAQTPPSPALQASIDKWAAIDRTDGKTDGDGSRNDRGGAVEAPGSGGSGAAGGSGRAPLSSTQERLLMELIGSQASSSSSSTARHRAAGLP
ncbi:hypothetical protein THAOC_37055, partial [Thalassiosira oceanica]